MNLHLTQISHMADLNGLPFRNLHPGARHAPAGVIGPRVARILAWIAAVPRRARERAELSRFTDRELADIGLTRGDIPRIHDRAFAADHQAGRTLRRM